MCELQYLPALGAFLAVMLFLVRRHTSSRKTEVCTGTSYRAASFSSRHSFLSSFAPARGGPECARATSDLGMRSRAPSYKRDPDIWIDDNMIGVLPLEASDTE